MNHRNLLKALQEAESNHGQLFQEAKQIIHRGHLHTDSAILSTIYNEVTPLVQEFAARPIAALPFTEYDLYRAKGSRIEFEASYFDRRRRLAALVVASLKDGVHTYRSDIENTIWAICDEYTWCLPAHLMNHDAATQGEEYKHIDLFASETAHALSETCFLLRDQLDGQVVRRAEREIMRRVLEPYMSVKRAYWWETCDINWSAVCAGSIGMTAIYTLPDSKMLFPILQRVISSMDCFLEGFSEEGACLEGLGYWYYGFGYYVYFSELLKQRTGGQFDLLQTSEKARKVAQFPQSCFLQGNHIANFSDCSRQNGIQVGIFSRLCEQFADIRIPTLENQPPTVDHCGRFAGAVRNVVWLNEALLGEREGLAQRTDFLPEAQWMVSRSQVGSKLISFAAKGGHNDEPHNHNDLGHFIWVVDGVRWFEDLGAGLYTKQYFGEERYNILCNSSAGHSVPMLNGHHQVEGVHHRAQVLDVERAMAYDRLTLELRGAYEMPALQGLEREFYVDKMQGTLTLTDEFVFNETGVTVTERFVTQHKPVLVRSGEIRLEAHANEQFVRYDGEQWSASIHEAEHFNHEGHTETVYLIDLTATAQATEMRVVVTIGPQ
ncbi:heparinase II/III domain-containing protein [Paenibacillus roseipurpureus]|uniref:Heparinase II/III family protein n=1 Tax=Paenibacillus roseopurpureus TaxID=2918901 RepID=A0AA96LPS1_9BACL|nr:heparinase II/III family protein [Paenibacillus sp. MBLB1832]WNR42655.1 heparinase II/III family protein [Paenibacillus sp. MBLB1832]